MRSKTRAEQRIRDHVTKLLSAEEAARLNAQAPPIVIQRGDEYMDLENLEQGVYRALGTAAIPMGRLIPRNAVSAATWSNILESSQPSALRIASSTIVERRTRSSLLSAWSSSLGREVRNLLDTVTLAFETLNPRAASRERAGTERRSGSRR